MKKTVGLALLLLSGLSAFAAPMVRTESFQKTAIVAHKNVRKGGHRGVKKANVRKASFRMQRARKAR